MIRGYTGRRRNAITVTSLEKKAKEIIFTGKTIMAQEAYKLGMINKVVRKEKLMNEVNAIMGELLKKKPNNFSSCQKLP